MISFDKSDMILVTGASSGIGKSIALLLNELGASVVAIGRDEKRLNELYFECKNKENMFLEQKDLIEDIEGLPKYISFLKDKYGKFRAFVYSAGDVSIEPLKAIDLLSSKKLFDINYFAPLFMLKGICSKKNNIGHGFSVVLISSIAASIGEKAMSVYSGSKAALTISAKCISKEYANLRINTISPSFVDTKMTSGIKDKYEDLYKGDSDSEYPLGFGKPEDIANLCVFLLSDKASWISGSDYKITGGGINRK